VAHKDTKDAPKNAKKPTKHKKMPRKKHWEWYNVDNVLLQQTLIITKA